MVLLLYVFEADIFVKTFEKLVIMIYIQVVTKAIQVGPAIHFWTLWTILNFFSASFNLPQSLNPYFSLNQP